jgi:hypothetical protein
VSGVGSVDGSTFTVSAEFASVEASTGVGAANGVEETSAAGVGEGSSEVVSVASGDGAGVGSGVGVGVV